MLIFRKLESLEQVGLEVASSISAQLNEGKRVLWFLSGGSAIQAEKEASRLLHVGIAKLENLTILLGDERYGLVDHPDSNWKQLLDAGFDFSGCTVVPVLNGDTFENTAFNYAKTVANYFASAHYKIGVFGIGEDGHTSGILPGSEAVASNNFAIGYNGGQYLRITITPSVIAQLNKAVVYAVGEAKVYELQKLQTALPMEAQPAQVLKHIPDVIVYNDSIVVGSNREPSSVTEQFNNTTGQVGN